MNREHLKTSQWVSTEIILGGALLKLFNYDGVGRVQSTTTLHVTRRGMQRLIGRMDEFEDEHAQDELPFA